MSLEKNKDEFENLIKRIREISGDNVTSITITLTADETKINRRYKYADQLKKQGSSMRNLKNEWIK